MFVPSKNKRKKKNAPADTEIISTDLKNENLTTKIRINKEEKQYFFKIFFQKIFK